MSRSLKIISHSAKDTQSFGARLAQHLKPGDVVVLLANLGAGKTTLVQGLVKKLGVREAALSPTFVIAQTFKGIMPIHHLDFYRLTPKEILDMGIQDYLIGGGVIPKGIVLIEWAERCREIWPKERLEVRIKIKPKSTTREIVLKGYGKRFENLSID